MSIEKPERLTTHRLKIRTTSKINVMTNVVWGLLSFVGVKGNSLLRRSEVLGDIGGGVVNYP